MVRNSLRFLLISLLVLGVMSMALPDIRAKLARMVDDEIPALVELYQYLHSHPELSLHETETAKKMAGELRSLGFEVTEGVGGTGVVGIYRNGEGPTVLIRTDIDALPITEKTDLPYASEVRGTTDGGIETGLMHACGHDMHMTVWTGTARTLIKMKDDWAGTLMMIGQPAEEIGAGAKAMLEDGLYQRFEVPDYGIALHCSPNLPAGKIGFASGFALASVDMVKITVYGEGGHGAYPHTTIDPAVLTSMIVMDLQTIVSRSVKPTDAAVVTVGAIHGGTQGNVIGDQMELLLTLRSYKAEVRDLMLKRIEEICNGNAAAMGLSEEMYPKVEFTHNSTPAVYNEPEMVSILHPTWNEVLGEENVLLQESVMGGEDFARYGLTEEDVPILMYWLGTVEQERIESAEAEGGKLPGLHSPFYYPDPEKTIRTGVTAMSTAVMELMEH